MTKNSDDPVCPSCGYSLVALRSSTCPECGRELGDDLSIYRPSRRRTPWSRENPRWLLRGVWDVIVHPIRTMDACDDPERVTTKRALLFALLVTGMTVLVWPFIRVVGQRIAVLIHWGEPGRVSYSFEEWAQSSWSQFIALFTHWHQLTWIWEAWSITRWWLLAGLVVTTISLARRGSKHQPIRCVFVRVALFSVLITLLEIGYLAGVWIKPSYTSVIPEPSTLFGTDWGTNLGLGSKWLIRGVAPGFIVWLVFFRAVMSWRWPTALIGTVVLVPASIYLSIAWTQLWIAMR